MTHKEQPPRIERDILRAMTISIGFVCKNSIVLAADSQTSYTGSTHKSNQADKLVEFAFFDGYAVSVMAGGIEYFEMFRELMEIISAKTRIRTERTIPDTVEEAISGLKSKLRKLSLPEQRNRDRMDRIFEANDFEMLVGFFFEGMPKLYYANFEIGRARKVNDDYKMIGAPLVLVDYLMDGVEPWKMTNNEGLALAACLIEVAKDHDSSCGGMTRMALIKPESPMILAQSEIWPFVMAALSFEHKRQREWFKSIVQELPPEAINFDWDVQRITRPRRLFENPSSEPRPSSPKPDPQPPPASPE